MRLKHVLLATAAAAAMAAPPVMAGSVNVFGDVNDGVQAPSESGNFRQGNGGEFKIQVLSGPAAIVTGLAADLIGAQPGRSFQSFCLEQDEYIWNTSNPYAFAEPIDDVVRGGGNNTDGGDQISNQTAWLYNQFRGGTLSSYTYASGASRESDAEQLQFAIWHLEDEGVSVSGKAAAWVAAANAAVLGGYVNTNVRALNLSYDGVNKQDMLVLVPTPQASLAGMSLLGVMGVMGFMKKRRKLQESELD